MRWRQLLYLLLIFAGVQLAEGGEEVDKPSQIRIEKTVTFSKSRSTSTASSSSSSSNKRKNTKTETPVDTHDDLTGSGTHTLLHHVEPYRHYPSQLPVPFTNSFSVTPSPLGRHRAVVGTPKSPQGSEGQAPPVRSSNAGPLAPAGLQTKRQSRAGRTRVLARTFSRKMAMNRKNAKKMKIVKSRKDNSSGEKEEGEAEVVAIPNSVSGMVQGKESSGDTEDERDSQAKNNTTMKPKAKSVIIAQMRKIISSKQTNRNQLRPTPVVHISYLGARTGSRPLVSPSSESTFRPLIDKKARQLDNSVLTTRKNNLTMPTKDMKMVLMVKADLAVASTTTPSPAVAMSETASPSMPLLRITTPAPLVRVTRKKHASKRVFQPANYLNVDLYHEPLYSMYGPPYDHYKLSAHLYPGGSFPSTYPQEHAYYPPSSYTPRMSSYSGLDYQQPHYFPHYDFPKKQKTTLPPYFSDDSPQLPPPSHSYSPSTHPSYSPPSPPKSYPPTQSSYSPPASPQPYSSPPPYSPPASPQPYSSPSSYSPPSPPKSYSPPSPQSSYTPLSRATLTLSPNLKACV
ncbi:arginine-glutamic acid dipeptide repeats protein-like [Penaeus monodon]|uniref:arginine-glutamic acid dipeptide repeats protein-like n=1 Tax=Penaeus monodon TaxID=6687 RepID=UPI0018A7C278|nr:arginine-glutamic acid dipeptide repeats protein-like [Penaeus monodon]